MEKEKYFRHCIIHSSDQNDVEKEIQYIYNDDFTKVINMTITPIRFENTAIPYGYDICYVYETDTDE